jgi:hypothetical protein
MSKQTAVEFLIDMISFTSRDTYWAMVNSGFLERAKEMEKQQIIDAYHTNPLEAKWKNIGINYYKETYSNDKQ